MKIRISDPVPACDVSPLLSAAGHRLKWREGKPTGQQVIEAAVRVLGRALTVAEERELLDTIRVGGQYSVETGDEWL